MKDPLQDAVAHLRAQALRAAWLGESSRLLLGALVGFGSLALLARLALGLEPERAALLLLPLVLVPLWARTRARRRVPGAAAAAAWLDVGAGGAGELVLGLEAPDERWRTRLDAALARIPEVPGTDLRRPTLRAAGGAAFVLAALLVPLSGSEGGRPRGLFAGTVAELREKLEVLEEQLDLPEERRAELGERLDQLAREDAAGREPASLLEALDGLEAELEREAEQAREAADRSLESLGQAVDAAERAEPEAGEQVGRAVEQALAQLELGDLSLPESLAQDLQQLALEMPGQGTELGLDPRTLERLAELGQGALDALRERLEGLEAAGLLEDLGKLTPGLDGEPVALADLRQVLDAEQASGEPCPECAAGKPCGASASGEP